MTVAEYLVSTIQKYGITDVFGIPGEVVLDFLHEMERTEGITPHLSYHEQGAAFEACGYAQVNYSLGAAYATRGPGFTNLITGIAEAYADSIPVLFITAHTGKTAGNLLRFEKDQELDTVSMVRNITKYVATVESPDECWMIDEACEIALAGRKGPVLVDVSSGIWQKEIVGEDRSSVSENLYSNAEPVISAIEQVLSQAQRPIILVGDGIRQAGVVNQFIEFADSFFIPVLSSRGAQDCGSGCENYYGYIGSHGLRHSNFIFAKADLVLAIGNRLDFPASSKTFNNAFANKKVVWVDIDAQEVLRSLPNTIVFHCDVVEILPVLGKIKSEKKYSDWLGVCNTLKQHLADYDSCETVEKIVGILKDSDNEEVVISDVGNNEFWLSQAYCSTGIKNRILYSKTYGSLGNSLSKAIGAYYATRRPVVCFTGDQGFQMNIQELQLIAQEKLPITVVVINNFASAMIRDRETIKHFKRYIHVTNESGYGVPDIEKVAEAYGIQYMKDTVKPGIVEIKIKNDTELKPSIPMGNDMQNMSPLLQNELYVKLNTL